MGKMTAARQKKITKKMLLLTTVIIYVAMSPATNPTHLAYGVTVLSQMEVRMSTTVVVTQMQPQKTQTRVTSHSGLREGV